jgi:hypothetical protein
VASLRIQHPVGGSSLDKTQRLRTELPKLLRRLGTTTLLDVGCGDFTWMNEVDLLDVNYIGVDIVSSVIDEDDRLFGSPTKRFILANAVWDKLPDADVVLCREILFRLSFDDARSTLRNILPPANS